MGPPSGRCTSTLRCLLRRKKLLGQEGLRLRQPLSLPTPCSIERRQSLLLTPHWQSHRRLQPPCTTDPCSYLRGCPIGVLLLVMVLLIGVSCCPKQELGRSCCLTPAQGLRLEMSYCLTPVQELGQELRQEMSCCLMLVQELGRNLAQELSCCLMLVQGKVPRQVPNQELSCCLMQELGRNLVQELSCCLLVVQGQVPNQEPNQELNHCLMLVQKTQVQTQVPTQVQNQMLVPNPTTTLVPNLTKPLVPNLTKPPVLKQKHCRMLELQPEQLLLHLLLLGRPLVERHNWHQLGGQRQGHPVLVPQRMKRLPSLLLARKPSHRYKQPLQIVLVSLL